MTIDTATLLLDARERDVAVLERADTEVWHRPVILFKRLEDETGSVDAIPLTRVDAIVFESEIGHVLNRKWSNLSSFIVVK